MSAAATPTTPPSSPEPSCPNCGSDVVQAYCAACGQSQRGPRAPLRELTSEAARETLSIESRLWRSLRRLAVAPGALARDHLDGRRASQLPPVRLYLVLSLFFFWAWSIDRPDFEALRVLVGEEVVLAPEPGRRQIVELELLGPDLEVLLEPLVDVEARRAELRAQPPELVAWRFLALTHDALASFWILALPALALLLRLLYARRGFLLYDHAVFLLYEQSLAFGVFGAAQLVASALGGGIASVAGWFVAGALVSAHLLIAMRRVYGGGWAGTALRFAAFVAGWALLWAVSLFLAFLYAQLLA